MKASSLTAQTGNQGDWQEEMYQRVPQHQSQVGAPSDQPQIPPLQQSLYAMQSQQPQQQQLEQMDNHLNQLQLQLNIGTMTRSNSSSTPNATQQGIQNMLRSDQLLTKDAELGRPAYSSAVRKRKKCKICGDCVHKRRK